MVPRASRTDRAFFGRAPWPPVGAGKKRISRERSWVQCSDKRTGLSARLQAPFVGVECEPGRIHLAIGPLPHTIVHSRRFSCDGLAFTAVLLSPAMLPLEISPGMFPSGAPTSRRGEERGDHLLLRSRRGQPSRGMPFRTACTPRGSTRGTVAGMGPCSGFGSRVGPSRLSPTSMTCSSTSTSLLVPDTPGRSWRRIQTPGRRAGWVVVLR